MRVWLLYLSLAIAISLSAPFAPAHLIWIPIWSTAALLTVARASWLADPRWFGKRLDGTQTALATVALAPFLLPLWTYWHVRRPLWSEPAGHELLTDLCIGRRLLSHELAPLERRLGAPFDHIVDLTCEYRESRALRRHPGYLLLPIVDGCAPSPDRIADLVQQILALPGRKFVHCAMGHGRASLIACAVLLARGAVTDPDDAMGRVRATRSKARPYAEQVQRLTEFWQLWQRRHAAGSGHPAAQRRPLP